MRRLAEADVCAAFVELLMPVLGNGFYSEFFRQIATAIAEKFAAALQAEILRIPAKIELRI